jgi:hypothetical protein
MKDEFLRCKCQAIRDQAERQEFGLYHIIEQLFLFVKNL